MIDTDKYEGHTPAPWDVREAGINRIMVYTDDEGFAYEEANRNLVADAPLLLAEVKRYKQVFDRAIECALNDNAEQAMQFLLNMDYCLDDEEIVTDENRKNYYWMNGEWRSRK